MHFAVDPHCPAASASNVVNTLVRLVQGNMVSNLFPTPLPWTALKKSFAKSLQSFLSQVAQAFHCTWHQRVPLVSLSVARSTAKHSKTQLRPCLLRKISGSSMSKDCTRRAAASGKLQKISNQRSQTQKKKHETL